MFQPWNTQENIRIISLESAHLRRIVGGMHLRRPGPLGGQGGNGVLRGNGVDGVRDPGVPERLDLRGVVVVLGVVDPARAQREFFLVLEELVAELVDAYESAGFGVACFICC